MLLESPSSLNKKKQKEQAFSFASTCNTMECITGKCKKYSNTVRVQEKSENSFISEVLQQLIELRKC